MSERKIITIELDMKENFFMGQDLQIDIAKRLDANGIVKIPVHMLPYDHTKQVPLVTKIEVVVEDEEYKKKLSLERVLKALEGLLNDHQGYLQMRVRIN